MYLILVTPEIAILSNELQNRFAALAEGLTPTAVYECLGGASVPPGLRDADAGLTAFTWTSICEMATLLLRARGLPYNCSIGRCSLITAAQPKTAKTEELYGQGGAHEC